MKYLGVILDNSWNDHVRQLRNKTNKTVKMLRKLSNSKKALLWMCGVVLWIVVMWCGVAVQRQSQMGWK